MYELIKYSQKNSTINDKEFQKERYLFTGSSCFPLSAYKKKDTDDNKASATKKDEKIGPRDQLKVIIRELGHQPTSETSFITSQHAIKYLQKMEQSCADDNIDISEGQNS